MYYDFYLNEQMLLENYKKGELGNRALRRLIGRSGMPADKCADMYLELFDNRLELYYDRYDVVRNFEQCKSDKNELLRVKNIKVYRQDIEFIKEQIKKYNLAQQEQLCLFGIVMMCRILNTDTIDLTTEFKIKQFCGCFDSKLYSYQSKLGRWYETYYAPWGMENVSDKYGILLRTDSEHTAKKIGCYYTYLNYELTDKTVDLEYVVTPDTNRLDLMQIYQDVGLKYLKFCSRCGKAFYSKESAIKYCDECSKIVKREKTRERVRRYRARHSTM